MVLFLWFVELLMVIGIGLVWMLVMPRRLRRAGSRTHWDGSAMASLKEIEVEVESGGLGGLELERP